MDHLALTLSEQLMRERRAEARHHTLATQARTRRTRTAHPPRFTALLRLAVRPARAEGAR